MMKLCDSDSPYEGQIEPPDDPRDTMTNLRVVGYMSKKGRATVWDNKNGSFSVVVNSSEVKVFTDFDQAEDYAIEKALGPQWRM